MRARRTGDKGLGVGGLERVALRTWLRWSVDVAGWGHWPRSHALGGKHARRSASVRSLRPDRRCAQTQPVMGSAHTERERCESTTAERARGNKKNMHHTPRQAPRTTACGCGVRCAWDGCGGAWYASGTFGSGSTSGGCLRTVSCRICRIADRSVPGPRSGEGGTGGG